MLELVAKRGFLGEEDIKLRGVCRRLRNVHRVILWQVGGVGLGRLVLEGGRRGNGKTYIEMKTEVAENSCPSTIEEIISLDVNRSLHIHCSVLPPTLLHTLLRTFAYYNREVGYCQGMNYLAGYIFLKVRD